MVTKKPPVMGVWVYHGEKLLGRAMEISVEGESVSILLGTIDRFEVLRYLRPSVARDLIGEKSVVGMPVLTVYCEGKALRGGRPKSKKKDKGPEAEASMLRLGFRPTSIEVGLMPGQTLSLKAFNGILEGLVEVCDGLPIPSKETMLEGAPTQVMLY
jgi:hypothetical protein